jgi:hypothetical protein
MSVISVIAISLFVLAGGTVAQKLSASQDNKKSEAQIRKALADWVECDKSQR